MPHPPAREPAQSPAHDEDDVQFTARTNGAATALSGAATARSEVPMVPIVSLPELPRWEQVRLSRRSVEQPDQVTSPCSNGSDADSSDSSMEEDEGYQLDAMDPETYRLVYYHRRVLAQTPMSSGSSSDVELSTVSIEPDPCDLYTKWELRLRQDFAANKLCWYGDFRKDLWCFVVNTNPVVSLCYSHPLHPISLWDRIVAYLIDAIFILLLSCAMMEAHGCFACGITSCNTQGLSNTSWVELPDEHWYNLMNSTGSEQLFYDRIRDCTRWMRHTEHGYARDTQTQFSRSDLPSLEGTSTVMREFRVGYNYCCVCSYMGITWWVEREMELFFVVIVNSIFILAVFQVMICCCVQTRSHRTRKYGERAGYAAVGLVAFVLCLLAPGLFWYMRMHNALRRMLIQLVAGKMLSWTVVSVWQVVLFAVLWRLQLSGSGLLPNSDGVNNDSNTGEMSTRSSRNGLRRRRARQCCAGPRGFLVNVSAAEFNDLLDYRAVEFGRICQARSLSAVGEAPEQEEAEAEIVGKRQSMASL